MRKPSDSSEIFYSLLSHDYFLPFRPSPRLWFFREIMNIYPEPPNGIRGNELWGDARLLKRDECAWFDVDRKHRANFVKLVCLTKVESAYLGYSGFQYSPKCCRPELYVHSLLWSRPSWFSTRRSNRFPFCRTCDQMKQCVEYTINCFILDFRAQATFRCSVSFAILRHSRREITELLCPTTFPAVWIGSTTAPVADT